MFMHANIDLPSSGDLIHTCPNRYPFINLGGEAIEIKHFAHGCNHSDPARIRTRDPLVKGPTPNHFVHHALSVFSMA